MADPLSVAAGIIGVATAAVQVSRVLTDLVRRSKDAPNQVTIVLSEVCDIYTNTTQLQLLVFDIEASSRSQTCLIQADSVTAILTGCVATFSELEQLINQLKAQDPIHEFGLVDRVKWATKQSSIAAIMSRLQAHKSSLSLILDILNGTTIQGVMSFVHRLEMTVRNKYEDMLGRLCTLQSQQISVYHASRISLTDFQETTQSLEIKNVAQESQVSYKCFKFEFEQELVDTRVYRRLGLNASISSLLTAENPEIRWSMISSLTVADVASNISVLNLTSTSSEVCNAELYIDSHLKNVRSAPSSDSEYSQVIEALIYGDRKPFRPIDRTNYLIVGHQTWSAYRKRICGSIANAANSRDNSDVI